MDSVTLRRALDEIFDHALVRHGFVGHMRDYEVVVHAYADPVTGIPPTELRYVFRHCVQANCVTSVPPGTWRVSLDDRLTDYETGVDLDGFVWGVGWQALYPGATLVEESPVARRWSAAVGIDFHEVRIQGNAHDLTLVFSDLEVQERPLS